MGDNKKNQSSGGELQEPIISELSAPRFCGAIRTILGGSVSFGYRPPSPWPVRDSVDKQEFACARQKKAIDL